MQMIDTTNWQYLLTDVMFVGVMLNTNPEQTLKTVTPSKHVLSVVRSEAAYAKLWRHARRYSFHSIWRTYINEWNSFQKTVEKYSDLKRLQNLAILNSQVEIKRSNA